MRTLYAFVKKEWLESLRSGKVVVLIIIFVLFGIMNPAIAKLTPWMMDMMSDALAQSGIVITEVTIDALTSWTQFFKNIPMGLIIFVLMYSNSFVKEYQTGTLIMVITKGLERYKVVIAKSFVMFSGWTVCFWLCFAVTYFYNAYFWDNGIVNNLFSTAAIWWLFGIWVISMLVFFSTLYKDNSYVIIGTGGVVVISYILGKLENIGDYTPTRLIETTSFASNSILPNNNTKAVIITLILCIMFIGTSIPAMNKKQIPAA